MPNHSHSHLEEHQIFLVFVDISYELQTDND